MNNSINLILVVLLIVLLYHPSFGQFEEMKVDVDQNVVISPNGLSIRSKPSLESQKLSVVPFGQKVKIENNESYGWDTIGTYHYAWGGKKDNQQPISGQWVKAKYKKIEGFMFNAYLGHGSYDFVPLESKYLKNINSDYSLLFPGMNCVTNINLNPKMKWYGVYEENGKYILRKANVGFYRIFGDLLDFGITTSNNKNLAFIIGSKKKLKVKPLKGKFYKEFGYNFFKKSKEDIAELKKYGIEMMGKNEYSIKLNLKQDSKSQILNPDDLEMSFAVSLIWAGDLDGDNKLDFIFHFGEKSGQTILFLSTESKDGDIVKPVAAYFSGYCC